LIHLPTRHREPDLPRPVSKPSDIVQLPLDEPSQSREVGRRAGTDESGKGDFFGPLVIAAVACDFAQGVTLADWGITDSKKLSDGRATKLTDQIKKASIPHSVVAIGPEKYNELYLKFKNLNRLLAWGHARAIENLLEQVDVDIVIADQFGDESLIQRALFEKGRKVRLMQMPRGEQDIAVAAASVMARAEFLRRLNLLGKELGVVLPKGAGAPVDAAGREIVKAHGLSALTRLAKTHFKNFVKVQS
jgi:ribonuclease HIII